MHEVTAPVCPLSLAANAVAVVTVGESFSVAEFEVLQYASGRFYVAATVHVVESFWPFEGGQCEHRTVVAHCRVGNRVFCCGCHEYVPVEQSEAGPS